MLVNRNCSPSVELSGIKFGDTGSVLGSDDRPLATAKPSTNVNTDIPSAPNTEKRCFLLSIIFVTFVGKPELG